MNYEIHVAVTTLDDRGNLLHDITATWEASMPKHPTKHDDLAALEGNGRAKIGFELNEKIGGPGYSSVGVHISISLTCNQDIETATRGVALCQEVVTGLMDSYVDSHVQILQNHVERAAAIFERNS